MQKLYLSNSKGEKSVTTTIFVIGSVLVGLKLLFSGISIADQVKFSEFTGIDAAAAWTALGGIYVLNKRNKNETKTNNE